MQRLDPKLDIVFKRLLTRGPPVLLIDMLEGILGRPIRSLTILDADISGDQVGDKEIVLDVRVELADGTRVDIEMQLRTPPALPWRIVYYGARDYSDQLDRGDSYHQLKPTVVIVWLAEPLFPELDQLHSVFELRERTSHIRFGEQLTFHVLQLSSLSKEPQTGYAAKVQRWARFFVADDAELERLAAEDPIMAIAKQTLERLSQDPETQRLARKRADDRKLYRLDLMACEAKGRAEVLLKLLGLRFGPPSEATRVQVTKATLEQLDAWAERVLTATTLDDVLVG